jgi:uncharacterized SAM-binding protein YcdF (DUF218 family)
MNEDDADSVAVETEPIGRDGLAMLALSCVVMLASLGTTLLAALACVVWIGATTPPTAPAASVIIVLGMRLGPGGAPRSRYRRRLHRASRLLAPGAEIIVLGGSTRAGVVSEAEAGMRYLLRRGVPREQIRLEEASSHTLENLRQYRARFYRAQFGTPAPERPVLVTNRFHLARSSLLARGMGLPHTLCAAEDRPAALLREAPRIVREAVLIHWYIVGRTYARWSGNERMTARIS